MFTSDTHHSYFHISPEDGRDFDIATTEDASLGGKSQYGIGLKFRDGGIAKDRGSKFRILKLKECGPYISRLHIKRFDRWYALPINRVTDNTIS